jgi:predicted HTH domain antitoxin
MQITIDLPDALQINEADLRTELAIALFQQERITLSTASQLAGLHQIEFQQLIYFLLSREKVAIEGKCVDRPSIDIREVEIIENFRTIPLYKADRAMETLYYPSKSSRGFR